MLKFNHFLFKNAFGIHCRLRKTFCSKLHLSIFCVETSVLNDLTTFCVKNCVLLKFNHFLFGIHCRLRNTFYVLNWIFQYFVLKPVFLLGLTPFCVKNCVLLKFNHFLFKNAFGIHCRFRKTSFVLNWIFQYFVLKAVFYCVWYQLQVEKDLFCSNLDFSIIGVQTSVLLGLTPFCVKNCVFLKFNHFLFKNAFRINCRLRKSFFVLN